MLVGWAGAGVSGTSWIPSTSSTTIMTSADGSYCGMTMAEEEVLENSGEARKLPTSRSSGLSVLLINWPSGGEAFQEEVAPFLLFDP